MLKLFCSKFFSFDLLDIFCITCCRSFIRNFQLSNERAPPSGLPVRRLPFLSYRAYSGTSSPSLFSRDIVES